MRSQRMFTSGDPMGMGLVGTRMSQGGVSQLCFGGGGHTGTAGAIRWGCGSDLCFSYRLRTI